MSQAQPRQDKNLPYQNIFFNKNSTVFVIVLLIKQEYFFYFIFTTSIIYFSCNESINSPIKVLFFSFVTFQL
jgi:hypothetical protein